MVAEKTTIGYAKLVEHVKQFVNKDHLQRRTVFQKFAECVVVRAMCTPVGGDLTAGEARTNSVIFVCG